METIALVGNPNSGKTTLFNALTGANQKTGNYAGVTVSRVSGTLRTPHGNKYELLDLPGCYSLSPNSPDERITRDVLLGDQEGAERPSAVVCVVDASNLERHLYLVTQIVDLGLPIVVALNKVDLAEKQGIRVNVDLLSEELGLPVVPCQANKGKGVVDLKHAIRQPFPHIPNRTWQGDKATEKAIVDLTSELETTGLEQPQAHAIHLLADVAYRTEEQPGIDRGVRQTAMDAADVAIRSGTAPDENISQSRTRRVQEICKMAARRQDTQGLTTSDKIDQILLHPVLGWVFFATSMMVVFWTIFSLAEYPMGWVEAGIDFVKNTVVGGMPEGDVKDLVSDGIIDGVGSVVIFLPQILLLLFFIGLMETTGYMSRAAFLMDNLMSKVGLSGKAFLPLLSSYACAIPGIMATRTMDSAKQRLLTIMIAPWMSCTARLPVYALLIGMLLAGYGAMVQALVLAGLYVLGTSTALLAAWLLAPRVKGSEEQTHFMMELPSYTVPDFKFIFRHLIERAWSFLAKAGTIILGISIILWALKTYPKPEEGTPAASDAGLALEQSYMGQIGHAIEPVVKPLGYDWRTGTALVAAFAAREVFNTSLAISYSVDEEEFEDEDSFLDQLRAKMNAATWEDGTPIYTPLTTMSLLVFFVYALQCLPTTAVVRRETGSWKWALGQLGAMSAFAWLAAFLVFQVGSLFV
ncbi:ferrous iron transport protein B [Verrucomicrobiaceae bacterium 5K15]|uniref:Ferrous iron transport protein B n=1 Tax=Oceaniferula flava TaxID=2800421 RepID=A0AAE2SB46_9BACT|nr:ferrous iron transport protein B [Oceaniferula flavus]MBK1854197.1 ferrous iron transport protein B [Oceaniferula flavus]MBM1135503.1 ferrous iron transport protein B [Oceaniferula flavus]